MPLLKLDRLCDGLEKGDWAGFLRDWDRALPVICEPARSAKALPTYRSCGWRKRVASPCLPTASS